MKNFATKFMAHALVLTALVGASTQAQARTYTEPEQCEAVVLDLVKKYVDIVDLDDVLETWINGGDAYKLLAFENTTPGTYNQEYLAKIEVKTVPNRYRTSETLRLTLKMTGEADCDRLRVVGVTSHEQIED